MTNSPIINAFFAVLYVTGVAIFMFYAPKIFRGGDTVAIPIAMLSLFVSSAAIMGFIFLSKPVQFYFDGEKKNAVSLFLKTLGFFAGFTILVFLILFFTPVI